jgi:uncharacterized protein (DUF488 family)
VTASLAREETIGKHRQVSGRIYSVGYEGMEVRTLIDHLSSAKVSLLVDVRLTPISRKKGFSRKALMAELEASGIRYRHDSDLGNPRDNRDSFRHGDIELGRKRMREMLEEGSGLALRQLVKDAHGGRIAVLCVERSHLNCHRDVVTEMAHELDPTIEVLQIL